MKIEIDYYHFENLNRNVLSLGNQVRDLSNENSTLKAEIERLQHGIKYWQIEAETDHSRWMRALEEIETLRKGV
jgi:predicted RNase H-like nuclease (RuvC/YqgF family)